MIQYSQGYQTIGRKNMPDGITETQDVQINEKVEVNELPLFHLSEHLVFL